MERADITELHYITPIVNVLSIMKYGIVSNELSMKLSHKSLAMEQIQSRRKTKQIPRARKLHQYANLYFDAHNPMLSKIRNQNSHICILCINPSILDLPDVIISDRNAASDWARFYNVTDGLVALDKDRIYAKYWTNANNQYELWEQKSIKCAEVLVPDNIEPEYILGAYVANQTALKTFQQLNIQLTIRIKSDIFF